MPSRFDTEFNTYVMPAVERAFGVDVTLSGNGETSESFTARRDKVESLPVGPDFAVRLNVEMRKFLLPVAKCVLGSQVVKPEAGFTITEGTSVWKILPPEEYALSVELADGEEDWACYAKKISG